VERGRQALESDRGHEPAGVPAPVALPNLMQVMWATVNRVSRSGQVMGPDERLTIEPMKINTIQVLETIKEGRTIYKR
jgi:predicted amidohydrolase YtcJ